MENRYVTYLRVSTRKQDLGLNAQQTIINNYIKTGDVIIASFIEKESGRNDNRVELNKAIEYCKQHNATLLIAKLDRLSRNLQCISTLMNSNLQFRALDIPTMDRLTIHIFASIAECEVTKLKERTKSALSEIKSNITKHGKHISKQGNTITKLGNPALTFKDEHRKMGVQAIINKKLNNPNRIKAKAYAEALKTAGKTNTQITIMLNESGFKSSNGGKYYPASVANLFK